MGGISTAVARHGAALPHIRVCLVVGWGKYDCCTRGAFLMRLTFPYPPSTNSLYRNVAGRGRVKTERYKTWGRAAGNEILTQKRAKISGPVELRIVVERKKGRNIDISNGAKGIEDLLVSMCLIDDDRNVQKISIEWGDETAITVTAV